MRAAIFGLGTMGREVESVLLERGHEIAVRADSRKEVDALTAKDLDGATTAFEFTGPDAVVDNIRKGLDLGLRMVVGSTGWSDALDTVSGWVREANGGLVYASNFSLGIAVTADLVRQASRRFERLKEFDVYLVERHHRGKKDAPSGTARALADAVLASYTAKTRIVADHPGEDGLQVTSIRSGSIVGEHSVHFDSDLEEVEITHRAKQRRVFALGAVWAGEWLQDHDGMHEFGSIIAEMEE